ncbi:MAG: IS630 transposase-related protein [Treponema sp.]|nr:IS630 transposase-related protein [Treponema sp.]
MAYSNDYRKRAVEYKDSGHTFGELREAFKIPPRTYYDWKQKFAKGYYDKKAKRQRRRKISREKLRQAWPRSLTHTCVNWRSSSPARPFPARERSRAARPEGLGRKTRETVGAGERGRRAVAR